MLVIFFLENHYRLLKSDFSRLSFRDGWLLKYTRLWWDLVWPSRPVVETSAYRLDTPPAHAVGCLPLLSREIKLYRLVGFVTRTHLQPDGWPASLPASQVNWDLSQVHWTFSQPAVWGKGVREQHAVNKWHLLSHRQSEQSACMYCVMTLTSVVNIVGHNAGKVTVSKLPLCLTRHLMTTHSSSHTLQGCVHEVDQGPKYSPGINSVQHKSQTDLSRNTSSNTSEECEQSTDLIIQPTWWMNPVKKVMYSQHPVRTHTLHSVYHFPCKKCIMRGLYVRKYGYTLTGALYKFIWVVY